MSTSTSSYKSQLNQNSELLRGPTTDPSPVYLYRDSMYAADMLVAALNVDFFTWLKRNPSSRSSICEHWGFYERPVIVMLTLFEAQGWITECDGVYRTLPPAEEHLCDESPWNLRPYYAAMHDRPIARDLLTVLRTDKPAGWSGDKSQGDWHRAMLDETFARRFTDAMDCRGLFLARELALRLDLSACRSLLDIGAGSAIYSCVLAAHNPHLTALALDQPPVDAIAAARIAHHGMAARVASAAGNFLRDPLPRGHDVHLLSNVLHDWDSTAAAAILAASHAALPPGGLVVVHQAILSRAAAAAGGGRPGPLAAAEYSVLLLHGTRGRCYTDTELAAMLRAAGFRPGPLVPTAAARGFISAVRE